jgi:nucleoside-diphosphate-sugar epimerase
MEPILVVGGSGFIGTALQKYIKLHNLSDRYTFTYHTSEDKIQEGITKKYLNLLDENSMNMVNDYHYAIYVAGNSNHGLAFTDPYEDFRQNALTLMNFLKTFRGSLVILSSQAVYYGLEGQIPENTDHVSTMSYGFSKQIVENYCRFHFEKALLQNLWIFRLMYTYGEGEKERRLIPACVRSTRNNSVVNISGGGKSFINPLPNDFVADVLVTAMNDLMISREPCLEITNLNHPEKVRVIDVLEYLGKLKPFKYEISEEGEHWPVHFWGDTDNLRSHLEKWNKEFPDVYDDLRKYFMGLLQNNEG